VASFGKSDVFGIVLELPDLLEGGGGGAGLYVESVLSAMLTAYDGSPFSFCEICEEDVFARCRLEIVVRLANGTGGGTAFLTSLGVGDTSPLSETESVDRRFSR
jgi:hypothetical protein